MKPPRTCNSILSLLALLPVLFCVATCGSAERPPNVVVLLADDLGWKDIGCYGGPVQTPALDKLASEGMRFTHFYSGAAVCSPSRAVLLTGRNNLRASIYSWINDQDQRSHLPVNETTLAEVLKSNGFDTAHFGKWHLGMPTARQPDKPTPSEHGFDYWFATANNAQPSHRNPRNFVRNGKPVGELKGYACDLVVEDAIQWLDSRKKTERPFFLNVWFHEPHAPLAAPPDLIETYGQTSDPAAIYSATIANTDQAIARLIKKLREIDAPENTLIIYSSDNGSYRSDRVGDLRGTKGSNYQGGVRVPGIFYWPGHIVKGAVTDTPAGLVDLLQTVCGLAKITPPERLLDGTDLSPLLRQESARIQRKQPLFWALPLAGPAFAIRENQYAMVAHREGPIPKDQEALTQIKRRIEEVLRSKDIYEKETRSSTFEKQLFEGFSDRDAERLRGQFIRLNQFHEAWIPTLKKADLAGFELYDLEADPEQKVDLSARLPLVHAKLKKTLQTLVESAYRDAYDWSSDLPIPGAEASSAPKIHRLETTFRSPFDAFLYVNRIPTELEQGESPAELAGRILGRLANQEGRVLVKLPPRMNRVGYEGFKFVLEESSAESIRGCLQCHSLPKLGRLDSTPPIPSLRNRSLSPAELKRALSTKVHRAAAINMTELDRLHAFMNTLSDLPDNDFRDSILKATVLDLNGDPQ
ncbi:MAG: sulfatase-like hydrolase/transferase [Planctomycetota bacterium]|nr:sulfatase-like hydrolase/transferase [Planctomycetota bacterium]